MDRNFFSSPYNQVYLVIQTQISPYNKVDLVIWSPYKETPMYLNNLLKSFVTTIGIYVCTRPRYQYICTDKEARAQATSLYCTDKEARAWASL